MNRGLVTPERRSRVRSRAGWRLVIAGVLGAFVAASAGCAANDDRSASWEYISPALFQPNCATVSCHSRASAVAGLDLSDPERGYTSLTGLLASVEPGGGVGAGCPSADPTVDCPKRQLVTPFVPAQSRVVNMLRARAAPRMPPDRPLSEADIRLVEKWILNGARKSLGGGAADAGADAGADGRDVRPADADAMATDGSSQ